MRLATVFSRLDGDLLLPELDQPLQPSQLLEGPGAWEVELGFGKGRYLLERAAALPERRFLGVELVSKYQRMVLKRSRRRGLGNLMLVRGEALYLLSSVMPRAFADKLHIYFPDPWPKSKHLRRRLLDPETVDLVLGILRPGGVLEFATDFLDYGEIVADILGGYPGLELERLEEPWPDGARTHYEGKFMREGRPILRLRARLQGEPGTLHPLGETGVLASMVSWNPPEPPA